MSKLVTATVKGGVLVSDAVTHLPEGLTVDVVVPDGASAPLSAADEAELSERLEAADRGDSFASAAAVLDGLRARRSA